MNDVDININVMLLQCQKWQTAYAAQWAFSS